MIDPANYMYSYDQPHRYWVIGFARSGTNWMARMLLDVMGKLDFDHYTPTELYQVGRLHMHLDPLEGPVVFSVRDPRDILVSIMRAFPEEQPTITDVLNHDALGLGMSTLEAIDALYHYWLRGNKVDCITSYERLWADTGPELRRIVEMLGIEIVNDPDDVAARHTVAITVQKFEGMNGDQHPRWPQAGPGVNLWRNEINRHDAGRIHMALRRWLFDLKFESDQHWWTDQKP